MKTTAVTSVLDLYHDDGELLQRVAAGVLKRLCQRRRIDLGRDAEDVRADTVCRLCAAWDQLSADDASTEDAWHAAWDSARNAVRQWQRDRQRFAAEEIPEDLDIAEQPPDEEQIDHFVDDVLSLLPADLQTTAAWLGAGRSQAEAAEQQGIHPSTVLRYHVPKIRRALQTAGVARKADSPISRAVQEGLDAARTTKAYWTQHAQPPELVTIVRHVGRFSGRGNREWATAGREVLFTEVTQHYRRWVDDDGSRSATARPIPYGLARTPEPPAQLWLLADGDQPREPGLLPLICAELRSILEMPRDASDTSVSPAEAQPLHPDTIYEAAWLSDGTPRPIGITDRRGRIVGILP